MSLKTISMGISRAEIFDVVTFFSAWFHHCLYISISCDPKIATGAWERRTTEWFGLEETFKDH